ncbi:MAG: hypothetical protein B6244_00420 [Candidatus Cloacimonetes bacterium 4572_55]|nr:MAG: hypothetical protein B6244_00420 [Candidatus Cloacimonetes bacterium 4572_55]
MISRFDQNLIDQFKKNVARKICVERFILFGSRARGDADPDSDMDILIITPDPLTSQIEDMISDCAWEAGIREEVVIMPVIMSRHEWEDGPERHSLLARAIRKEGVVV